MLMEINHIACLGDAKINLSCQNLYLVLWSVQVTSTSFSSDSVSKNAQYSVYYIKQLCTSQARPPPKLDSVISIPDRSSLDVSLPCLSAIWVLLFLVCSILSFLFDGNGYFYCICALHIVFNNDILQRVLRAVTKNSKN